MRASPARVGRNPLHPDRLLPTDPGLRRLARDLLEVMRPLPLVCPHGHVDAGLLDEDGGFANPVDLLITGDHYVTRLLASQGISYERLGIPRADGTRAIVDPREAWRLVARNWHIFRATPSRLWLEIELAEVFGVEERLTPETADGIYDTIAARLAEPGFRPRALFERFRIEVLATTESPLDGLEHHRSLAASGWKGRVVPTFRPDDVTDPDAPGWGERVERLGAISGHSTARFGGYLDALRERRRDFVRHGATATDHGHPTAATFDLDRAETARLYVRLRSGRARPGDAERFRGAMLVEYALMSLEDGLVMQLHPGSWRGHATSIERTYGPDRGFDVPVRIDFVAGLRPLLQRVGFDPRMRLIVFTLDETTYSRELAPLAGAYPALLLGPAWWFNDSPQGMRRYRELTTETAGFYNTVGFNDDTRAFCSIPARHDVARRVDSGFLAELVGRQLLDEDEAADVAADLAYRLAKQNYRL